MTTPLKYDALIIGGGAAGLSAAVALGRSRRTVLVIDAGNPRNAPAAHAHNYLGREGVPPLQLLEIGRTEARSYGAEIVSSTAVAAAKVEGGFTVTLGDGTSVIGRSVLVATGLTDTLPDIPGIAERWGREVLHCPYCHGWEVRDQALGIIGGKFGVHQALMWRQWTEDIVLFTQGFEPSEEDQVKLEARGVRVETDEIAALAIENDTLIGVRTMSGNTVPVHAVVVKPKFEANADILLQLGLETTELMMGDVPVGATSVATDPTGATSVAGIWAAGNVTSPMEILIGSAAGGVRAAGALNAYLIDEDVRSAVRAANDKAGAGTQS